MDHLVSIAAGFELCVHENEYRENFKARMAIISACALKRIKKMKKWLRQRKLYAFKVVRRNWASQKMDDYENDFRMMPALISL